MATFTLTIPNNKLQDTIDAWSEGYQSTLPDGSPNPQTRAQYAREQIRQAVNNHVYQYLIRQQTPPEDPGITIS